MVQLELVLFLASAGVIFAGLYAAVTTRLYMSFILGVVNFTVFTMIFIADAIWGSGQGGLVFYMNWRYFGFSPSTIIMGDVSRLDTIFWHLFAHADWLHLFGNTLMLFIIGLQLENKIKRPGLALTYFASGLGGTLMYTAMAVMAGDYFGMGIYNYSIGASGCVFGLLGTYMALYPNEELWFPLLLIRKWPVWLIAGVYFGFTSIMMAVGSPGVTNHGAHLGGFATGMLVAPLVRRLIPDDETGVAREMPKKSLEVMRGMAEEDGLEDLYVRIEAEDIPEVRQAWSEKLLRAAGCPRCGKKLRVGDGTAKCRCGFTLKY